MGVRGKTNNPHGRPKGSINKMAESMRENVLNFLANNFSELEERMKSLTPNEYVRAYIDLMKYGIYPAQAPKEAENKDKNDSEELRGRIIEASTMS